MSDAVFGALRPLLFRLAPETAHDLAMTLCGEVSRFLQVLALRGWPTTPPTGARLERRILGRVFPNPIGLAAGFDKNALAPHIWPWLGFGFAELGTVTALPQAGNDKPRMFRFPEQRALINRLGFNNQGAEQVAELLQKALDPRPQIPLGLNIGASRVHMGDPVQEVADYRSSAERLGCFADYVALNVSSPNTPGLRDLQAPARLTELVRAVRDELDGAGKGPPLLVKLAPDLDDSGLGEVAQAALAGGAEGFIATNTTLSREGLPGGASGSAEDGKAGAGLPAGGMSGAPLCEPSLRLLRRLRQEIGPEVPVIGVGGIFTVGDVVARLEAGADLVALYSAMIFEGPFLARRLAWELGEELERRGLTSVTELKENLADRSAPCPA